MTRTLRELLNADLATHVPEGEWVELIRSIAAADRRALHALYERAHRVVHMLSLRLTGNDGVAAELTLDVFQHVWRSAAAYDRATGSVMGWILNQTRSRAIERRRLGRRDESAVPRDVVEFLADRQSAQGWTEPDWSEVAPGISCKLLAIDAENACLSMLVRLAPGTHYPPHRHGGTEELHLLDGELWIDYRKLVPGDYSRREAGTEDRRVWSRTGCTCFLMTSSDDELR